MNSRFATIAAASTLVLAGWVVAWLFGFGSATIANAGEAAMPDRGASSAPADAAPADAVPAAATGAAAIDQTTAAESVTAPATVKAPGADEPQSTQSTDAAGATDAQREPPGTAPAQVTTASAPDVRPGDAREDVSSVEIDDECLVVDICIDRFLWSLYQETPKEDSIRVEDQRKVTVKRKGKTRTVTKSFTRLVDENFAWKDPKAAEKAGMPMKDYVIGGMDPGFKLRLFQALHAAETAGLSPGITSAFRDNYRQSLASGLRAAVDRSYHGGSLRGGYGHGLAADIVSIKGVTRDDRYTSSENLWKWIDQHGKEFGIARPYLDRDPAHVAPSDGQEYADHHREPGTRVARAVVKKRHQLAARDDHKRHHLAAHDDHKNSKHAKTARASKVRTI